MMGYTIKLIAMNQAQSAGYTPEPDDLSNVLQMNYWFMGILIGAVIALFLWLMKMNDKQAKDSQAREDKLSEESKAREDFMQKQLVRQLDDSKSYMDLIVDSMKSIAESTKETANSVKGCQFVSRQNDRQGNR